MAFAVVLAEEVRLTGRTLGAAVRQHRGSGSSGFADVHLGVFVARTDIVALIVVGVASRHGW
jgi:hypothetical protein